MYIDSSVLVNMTLSVGGGGGQPWRERSMVGVMILWGGQQGRQIDRYCMVITCREHVTSVERSAVCLSSCSTR